MTTLSFGRSREHRPGGDPAVATDDDAILEVHATAETTVRWTAGTTHPADVTWDRGDGSLGRGIAPAVALAGDAALACYQWADDGTVQYRVGTVGGAGVEWDDGHVYGDGVDPDVALDPDGTVVLVHGSTAGSLYCCVGQVDGTDVIWAAPEQYDYGKAPSVAATADGDVVEVHEAHRGRFGGYGLRCRRGTLDGDGVGWAASERYDSGLRPSVALGEDGELVAVHATEGGALAGSGLYAHHGRLTAGGIDWAESARYGTGRAPSVDRSGPRVVELHRSAPVLGGGRLRVTSGGLRPYDSWMGANPALLDRELHELTLPGTHDCGAYDLGSRVVPDTRLPDWLPRAVARHWARTQRAGMAEQLESGVRWFDLRVAERDGTFHFHHLFLGPEIRTMLGEVREFLGRPAVTNELVVLEASHFRPADGFDHDGFVDLVTDELDGYLYERPGGRPLATVRVGDVVGDGSAVVVVYDDAAVAAAHDALWPFEGIYSEFSDTTDPETMWADQAAKLDRHGGSPDGLFELQWVLTANASYVLGHPAGDLETLSWEANRHLGEFFRTHPDRAINLVRADFFRDGGVVDLAIERNGG